MAKALKMLSGKPMPLIGFGTWQSRPGEVEQAVKVAVECGYRHIDTAQIYLNEGEIGNALSEIYKEGKVKREDLYIVTKVSGGNMIPERLRSSADASLKKLQTDYVDLLLIHFPVCPSDEKLDADPPTFFPTYKNGVIKTLYVDPLDSWREMEKLVDEGKAKAIGLSNFNKEQIQRIWDEARIKPSNLQVECHAWFPQNELVDFCKEKGITVSAYGPIGSPGRPSAGSQPRLLDDPVVVSLAEKYQKTPAQILLRYLLQRDIIVLPKSVTPERIKQNFDVSDFEIANDDMEELKKANKEQRLFNFLFMGKPNVLHPFWPFKEITADGYKPGTLDW